MIWSSCVVTASNSQDEIPPFPKLTLVAELSLSHSFPGVHNVASSCECLFWEIGAQKGDCTFWHSSNLIKTSQSLVTVQFSSVAQSCLTLCDPVNHSTPGLPVHHHLLEFTQTHVQRVRDAIQPSHPRSSPSPPAPNPSQHQRLFQWVNSSHEVAKVLELQL